ncbi:MAG: acyl-CoA thioesterase [Clostridia bacterium]
MQKTMLENHERVKTPSDSISEQIQLVFSAHINGSGRLFGGKLLEWMDVLAAVVAKRHSEHNVTTVSINKVDFEAPALLNDTVLLIGKIIHAGKTSMSVKVTVYVEKLNGKRKLINTATFVLVALGDDDKPVPVPRLQPITDEEKADFAACEEKRQARMCQSN